MRVAERLRRGRAAELAALLLAVGAAAASAAPPPERGGPVRDVDLARRAGCDARFVSPLDGAVFPAGFPPPRFQWEVFMIRNLIGLPKAGTGETWMLSVFEGDRLLHVERNIGEKRSWTPTPAQWSGWTGKNLRVELRGEGAYAHAALPLHLTLDARALPDDVLLRYFAPASGAEPFVLNSSVDVHLLKIDTKTFARQELFVGKGAQRRCIGCHTAQTRGGSISFIYTNTARRPVLRGAFELTPSSAGWTSRLLPVAGPYARYSHAGDRSVFSMFRSTTPGEPLYYQITTPGASSGDVLDYPAPFDARFVSPSLDVAVYDEKTGALAPLPGASEPDFVELQPSWSPDDRRIAFVRYRDGERMDIAVVLYNDGRGGAPKLLAGASANGWDNYYPEYSPDGRWLAFTRADAIGGTFARQDSAVYLVPAGGGKARRLEFNQDGAMNSWHSWSSDGRWMLFASKRGGVATKAYISRIDSDGHASAPVELCCGFVPGARANMPAWIKKGDYPRITEDDVDLWERQLSAPKK